MFIWDGENHFEGVLFVALLIIRQGTRRLSDLPDEDDSDPMEFQNYKNY